MWIIQEPNKLALWNKLHFEEKNGEYRACLKYLVPVFVEEIYTMQRLEVSGAVRLIYRSLGVKGLICHRQGAIALNPCCCVWCPLRIEPWNRGCEFCSHQRYVYALSVTVCYFLFAFVLCVEEGKDFLQNFGCKTLRKSQLGSTVYVWMIILKWVLKEIGWKDVEWVNFTGAGTSARLFWTWQWSFALHNPRGIIPSLADKLFNN